MSRNVEKLLENQSLASFIEAKDAASTFLKDQQLRNRALNFTEALVLQAANIMLTDRPAIYSMEIMGVASMESGSLYPIMTRFEHQDKFFTSEEAAVSTEAQVRHRNMYTPTYLGTQVLSFFEISGHEQTPRVT